MYKDFTKEPKGSFFIGSKQVEGSGEFRSSVQGSRNFEKRIISLYDMLKFQAHRFVSINDFLEVVSENLAATLRITDADEEQEAALLKKELAMYKFVLGKIGELADEMGLPFTAKQAQRVSKHIDVNKRNKDPRIPKEIKELRARFTDELSDRIFFVLNYDEAQQYEELHPFGEAVSTAFPSLIFDIEEANKCLSLGRSTASVMHLMRVVDASLAVVGAPLNVDTATCPSWHSFLTKLQSALNTHYGTTGHDGWWKHNEFYCDIMPQLYAIKNAWRNPAFHAADKYTESEAGEIFDAVRGFVGRLALNMPITL